MMNAMPSKIDMTNKKGQKKRHFTPLFLAWLILLTLIVCTRFVAGQHRYLDLIAGLSGFTLPLLGLTLLIFVIRGRWVLALWALSIAAIPYQPIHHSLIATFRGSPNSGAAANRAAAFPWGGGSPYIITILVANAGGSEASLRELNRLIQQHQPDLVAIIEAGQQTDPNYFDRNSSRSLHYEFIIPPDNSILNSTMILSRHPLQRLEFADDPKTIDEEIYAFHHTYRVNFSRDLDDATFIFTTAHPPSPRTNASWQQGNKKTKALARLARRELVDVGLPVIIAGDFNTPTIGYRQQIMHADSTLTPSDDLIGGALTGTWPASYPAPFRLTLDRLWVTPDKVKIIERQVLPTIGSDHNPVLFTVDFDFGP